MVGKAGLTTEGFVKTVAEDLTKLQAGGTMVPRPMNTGKEVSKPSRVLDKGYEDVDQQKVAEMFDMYNTSKNGSISFDEFVDMAIGLGIAPVLKQDPDRR